MFLFEECNTDLQTSSCLKLLRTIAISHLLQDRDSPCRPLLAGQSAVEGEAVPVVRHTQEPAQRLPEVFPFAHRLPFQEQILSKDAGCIIRVQNILRKTRNN